MNKSCARAIVIRDGKLLVMERHKLDRHYYTLLGGAIEKGESGEQAVVREIAEESTLTITNPRLVFIEEAGDPFGTQYIYLCDYVSGEPSLPPNSEEAFWSKPGTNTYNPMWLPLNELPVLPFVSELLKEAMLKAVANGWPEQPYRFSSKHAQRLS